MNRQRFRMIGLVFFTLLALTLAACGSDTQGSGRGSNAPSGDPNNVGAEVHMSNTLFEPDTITIKAGTSIMLIADTFAPHFIANGTWEGNTAKPAREPDAPLIDNEKIDGNQRGAIGPFTAPGTFQLYCTIHPGMNLAVTVE